MRPRIDPPPTNLFGYVSERTLSLSRHSTYSNNSSGRTFKRHRDSRSDESTVHARTLEMMWEGAQRRHSSPPMGESGDMEEQEEGDSKQDAMVLDDVPDKDQMSLTTFFKPTTDILYGPMESTKPKKRDKCAVSPIYLNNHWFNMLSTYLY